MPRKLQFIDWLPRDTSLLFEKQPATSGLSSIKTMIQIGYGTATDIHRD